MKIPPWLKKILNCGYDVPVSQLAHTYTMTAILHPFQFDAYEIRAIRESEQVTFEVFDLLRPDKPMVLAGHIHKDGTRCWTYTKLRNQFDLFHKLSKYAQEQFKP